MVNIIINIIGRILDCRKSRLRGGRSRVVVGVFGFCFGVGIGCFNFICLCILFKFFSIGRVRVSVIYFWINRVWLGLSG